MSDDTYKTPSDESTPQARLPGWLEDITGEDDARAPQPHGRITKQSVSPTSMAIIAVVVVVLGVLLYALYLSRQTTVTEGPAPKFDVTVFDHAPLDYGGSDLKLADLQGQVVVINFWASYCGPCRDEAVLLENLYQQYRADGVVFLGINTDDIESNALAYLDEYGVTYPNAPDKGGKIEDDYRITGIPETFVVNKQGEIAWHIPAPITDGGRALRAEIDEALRS